MSNIAGGYMELDKKEAAEYLDINVRTLERWAKSGKVNVIYKAGTNGEIATFDQDELDQIKEEKLTVRVKPSMANITTDTSDISEIVPIAPGGFLAPLRDLIERLVAAIENLRGGQDIKVTPAMLVGKLLLTLPDAMVITGLSREILMGAIKDGALPSKIMGKAYRIKPQDLRRYLANLDFTSDDKQS
jgi:hypothetical protein